MKKVAMIGAVGAILVVAVVGLGYSNSFRALWNRTTERIEQEKSPEQLIAEIEVGLGQMDGKIVNHEVKLKKAQRQIASLETEVTTLSANKETQVAALKKARDLLASSQDSFTIGTENVTRARVEYDVVERLAKLKIINQQLDLSRAKLHALKNTHEQGVKVLADAKLIRQTKTAELDALKYRLTNAKQMAEIHELTKDIAGSGLTNNASPVGKQWENLVDRINAIEVQYEATQTPGLINYDGPAGGRDFVKEIDAAVK